MHGCIPFWLLRTGHVRHRVMVEWTLLKHKHRNTKPNAHHLPVILLIASIFFSWPASMRPGRAPLQAVPFRSSGLYQLGEYRPPPQKASGGTAAGTSGTGQGGGSEAWQRARNSIAFQAAAQVTSAAAETAPCTNRAPASQPSASAFAPTILLPRSLRQHTQGGDSNSGGCAKASGADTSGGEFQQGGVRFLMPEQEHIPASNVGYWLLRKVGWQEGTGLGVHEQVGSSFFILVTQHSHVWRCAVV